MFTERRLMTLNFSTRKLARGGNFDIFQKPTRRAFISWIAPLRQLEAHLHHRIVSLDTITNPREKLDRAWVSQETKL